MHLEGWHGAWQGCSSARGAWNLGCAVSGIHLALTALTIQGVGILNLLYQRGIPFLLVATAPAGSQCMAVCAGWTALGDQGCARM